MKRLILLVALVMAMAVLAPAAFADDSDTDEIEGSDVEMEEKDASAAQTWKAQMIADYFAELSGDTTLADPAVVMDLRSGEIVGHTVGWGVVFKLMLYADVEGVGEAGVEGGWALGQLRKAYLIENPDAENLHKNNLGQAHQASKDKSDKPEKTMPPQSNKDGKTHDA